MLKVTSGIYSIRNINTGFIYIGSSKNIDKRFNQHRRLLSKGSHPNHHLQNSFNKHGAEAFIFSSIYEVQCNSDELLEYEKLFMLSEDPNQLYNIFCPLTLHSKSVNYQEFQDRKVRAWKETVDKQGGLPPHSEERKKHQSQAVSGEKNGFYGKHHTQKTKEKLREKALEQWGDVENRIRQSKRRKQYYEENPEARAAVGMKSKGRKQPLEQNLKKSLSNSGAGNPNAKPIVFGGVTYGCIKDACLALNISKYRLKKLLKPNDYLEKE